MTEHIQPISLEEHVRKRPGMYLGDITVKNFLDATLLEIFKTFEAYRLSEIILDFDREDITCTIHSSEEFLTLEQLQNNIEMFDADNVQLEWRILTALTHNLSLRFQTESNQNNHLEFDGKNWTSPTDSDVSCFLEIQFRLSPEVFPPFQHEDFYLISSMLKEFALLNAESKLRIRSSKGNLENCFCYAEGAKSFLFEQDHTRFSLGDGNPVLTIEHSCDFCSYRLDLRFLHSGIPFIHNFVNGSRTQGGSHLEGVAMALDEVFPNKSQGCQTHEFIYCPDTYSKVQIPKTLIGVLSVKCTHPSYRAPTRDILCSDEIRDFIFETSKKELAHFADTQRLRFLDH